MQSLLGTSARRRLCWSGWLGTGQWGRTPLRGECEAAVASLRTAALACGSHSDFCSGRFARWICKQCVPTRACTPIPTRGHGWEVGGTVLARPPVPGCRVAFAVSLGLAEFPPLHSGNNSLLPAYFHELGARPCCRGEAQGSSSCRPPSRSEQGLCAARGTVSGNSSALSSSLWSQPRWRGKDPPPLCFPSPAFLTHTLARVGLVLRC